MLYNVDDLPQTLMSNPGASLNFDGHIGVPFLSQIHLSAGSTGLNLYDIFSDENANVNVRVTNSIRKLTDRDYFTLQEQISILSLGWRLNKDHYLSTGIYQELDMFSYFPKDPALLVSEGNNEYINVPFDFSHVAFTGEIMTVYHIGLNKKMDRRLTLGGRFKLYSGIFNVESVDNTGFFLTKSTPDRPNYYSHFVENLNLRVNTSGYASLKNNDQTVQESLADLLKRSFFGGNIGVGFDFGGTYLINENLIATAAVQDIGLMFHQKDVENYLYYGSYETDGLEPLFPDVDPNGETLPYWDIFEDEIDRNLTDETVNEPYITWRPFKLNGSLSYAFGEKFADCDYRKPTNRRFENSVGFQIYGINRPKGVKYAFTTFYDKRFNSKLRMKLTYTVDDFSYTNVGLLMSADYKKFNFYLAADNLFGYLNLAKSQRASVQLGLQFILHK
jgi:hypothetical protein